MGPENVICRPFYGLYRRPRRPYGALPLSFELIRAVMRATRRGGDTCPANYGREDIFPDHLDQTASA